MASLFFALASATSSEAQVGPGGGCSFAAEYLALIPGSSVGWRSARCCSYPQELLLKLERGAEVREIEIVVGSASAFTPRKIEVHFSGLPAVTGVPTSNVPTGFGQRFLPPTFSHVGTVRFRGASGQRNRSAVHPQSEADDDSGRLQVAALCSGLVRLIVHAPLEEGVSNPYQQVAVEAVDIWGHELAAVSDDFSCACPSRPEVPLAGDDGGEVARVLLDLGIPLDLLPAEEVTSRLASAVDAKTRRLMAELEGRRERLMRGVQDGAAVAAKGNLGFRSVGCGGRQGEVQQLDEHLHSLATLGEELHGLLGDQERLVTAGQMEAARALNAPIRALEGRRLAMAALHDTDFWLEEMTVARDDDYHAPSAALELKPTAESAASALPVDASREQPSSPSRADGWRPSPPPKSPPTAGERAHFRRRPSQAASTSRTNSPAPTPAIPTPPHLAA
eukprot:TRINITY_DN60954_c0_g1_i1.p1 TRINITY_DN60954_c0_g1~~TRINITY_DN60954_c0_g1_i1.p1  ORF type:complete len:449 (+),score=86.96 TRINITY_DN60954_c0_g1_i1:71-1417(+)